MGTAGLSSYGLDARLAAEFSRAVQSGRFTIGGSLDYYAALKTALAKVSGDYQFKFGPITGSAGAHVQIPIGMYSDALRAQLKELVGAHVVIHL